MAEEKKFKWEQIEDLADIESDDSGSRRVAAALAFDPEKDSVPTIKAVGQGQMARKIIETAKENDVPVVKDESLAESLATLNIGQAIPPELYEVVARLLIFISKLDQK